MAYDVAPENITEFAEIAVSTDVKRVVFAVKLPEVLINKADLENRIFGNAVSVLRLAEIDFTIIAHGQLSCSEGPDEIPFRMIGSNLRMLKVSGEPAVASDLQNVR
jgi:hypothetical protein